MAIIDRFVNNNNRKWANREFEADKSDIVFEVNAAPGTETDVLKYLDKGSLGTGLVIRCSDTVQLTSLKVGGTEMLVGDPITISTAGFVITHNIPDFTRFTIRITEDNTQLRVLVL